MCRGGRQLADFEAGTREFPDVPEIVARSLTQAIGGMWVVWAHKVAHRCGAQFGPLTGGEPYPWDAIATCVRRGGHRAPSPGCTCGFHALSDSCVGLPAGPGTARLDVALSGRVLAFEWQGGGVLFRAARQTVARIRSDEWSLLRPPDDPDGRLAAIKDELPRGVGPVRLRLPNVRPPLVVLDDDAGFCMVHDQPSGPRQDVAALVTV